MPLTKPQYLAFQDTYLHPEGLTVLRALHIQEFILQILFQLSLNHLLQIALTVIKKPLMFQI